MQENVVHLKITSLSHSPEEITKIIGLRPDFSWTPGSFRSVTTIRESTNGWRIESKLPKEKSFSLHIQDVMSRIAPYRDKVKNFSTSESVVLYCAVYSTHSPEITFSKEQVDQFSMIGAQVEVDVYVLGDDEDTHKN